MTTTSLVVAILLARRCSGRLGAASEYAAGEGRGASHESQYWAGTELAFELDANVIGGLHGDT